MPVAGFVRKDRVPRVVQEVHVDPNSPKQPVDDPVPREGLIFQDLDEAYQYYNKYAWINGFSIQKGNMVRRKNGVPHFRSFVCSKEGKRREDKRRQSVQAPHPETRIGCEACMALSINSDGTYKVSRFKEEHNHPVVGSPTKRQFLASQRCINGVQATQIEFASSSGIAPTQAYELQSRQAGGRENLGFLNIDLKNYLRHKRKETMEKGVAGAILEYFKKKQEENCGCYYSFQLDVDEQMTNIFWADARMIVDYYFFGDVVSFDTTYRTNDYGRPFAPILGVNHHNQTIVFGGALLYDEIAESFMWLFETFLSAMSGKRPKSIFTDQSAAMAKAIATVLPDTHHRLCTWHIFQNALKHLNHVFRQGTKFRNDFSRCIYEYESESEFLAAWERMLNDHDLKGNKWLEELFKDRHKWAMAYERHTFCANLRSTQRSESFNFVIRRFLNSRIDPLRFFEHFERLVEARRHEESMANFKTMNSTPTLLAPCPLLKQASMHYTLDAFMLFQEEWRQTYAIQIYHICDEDEGSKFKAVDGSKHRESTLILNNNTFQVRCSCCKFEFSGIQCCHVLKLLIMKNQPSLHSDYLLKRWSKEAKSGLVVNHKGAAIEQDTRGPKLARYTQLMHNFVKIASLAAEHQTTFEVAREMSLQTMRHLEYTCKGIASVGPDGVPDVNNIEGQSNAGIVEQTGGGWLRFT
ncbi:hypothetical protein H6P81_013108 [Aristolochia fimbriata]|uniref:SWIM-type domain-containing protein n=1 Tax=Aristolochia fimbriata TaxID=158543 RepID=A0AAV7EFX6_ARIFI|nr:hypothetical protein H6P81_013108 [Aristolochia fimbriata]